MLGASLLARYYSFGMSFFPTSVQPPPDGSSSLGPRLAWTVVFLILTHLLYSYLKSYAATGLFSPSHMGSRLRFPHLQPSLSLPSIAHLRSPDSPVHRHLVPPPLKSRRASPPLHPLPEEPSTELDATPLGSGPRRRSPDRADDGIADSRRADSSVWCSLCRGRIPDHVEPCAFPETAPAATAALSAHVGRSTGPRVFCYACWVWIHNLSICWTCGDTVSRKEERVSYGWCWWHWACVSCLFCRVSGYVFFIP